MHFAQYRQLTVAVRNPCLVVAQRIVLPGVLGDTHNGGSLSDAQVLHVFAEIGLGSRFNAIGLVSEIDKVEVGLQNLLLAVLFMEAERPENLKDLAANRDLILPRDVFDHLLRDGGSAAGVIAHQGVVHAARGAFPVHALMLIETFVLDGNQRFDHMIGNLLILHQRAVLIAVELGQLDPTARTLILIVDCGALLERVGRQIHIHLRLQHRVHIFHKRAEKKCPGQRADDRKRQNQLEKAEDQAEKERRLLLFLPARSNTARRGSARFRAAFFHVGPSFLCGVPSPQYLSLYLFYHSCQEIFSAYFRNFTNRGFPFCVFLKNYGNL